MVCEGLFLLLGVVKGDISPLAGTYADRVLDGDDEDTPVADLARARRADDRVDGLVAQFVADDQDQHHALDDVRFIHHAAVDAAVAGVARAPHIDVGEPLHAVFQQGFLRLLEPRSTDDSFDFLHNNILDWVWEFPGIPDLRTRVFPPQAKSRKEKRHEGRFPCGVVSALS